MPYRQLRFDLRVAIFVYQQSAVYDDIIRFLKEKPWIFF